MWPARRVTLVYQIFHCDFWISYLPMIKASALVRSIRPFSSAVPRSFLGNFFGTKEAKKKEIIEKQDEYEVDASSKIVILDRNNSPDYKPFNAAEDMPDFKIIQWKSKVVRAQDIESSFTPESVAEAICDTYSELKGSTISPNKFSDISLADLQFRFDFAKALQLRLGFDISDYTMTRAHNVDYLYLELRKVIAHRWSSERNPNAIVLRPEDFSETANVYLNRERTEEEQKKALDELVEKVRASASP